MFSIFFRMRRRELQSFTLKLSELKEYEQIRAERNANKTTDKFKSTNDTPIVKAGPKSTKEIRERVGLE
jgi:hypothetical protein